METKQVEVAVPPLPQPVVISGASAQHIEPERALKHSLNQTHSLLRVPFQRPNTDIHYFVVLRTDINLSAEDMADCQGAYRCYNCGGVIPKRIYFYPTRLLNDRVTFVVDNPVMHCCPSCVRGTVETLNKAHLRTLFMLQYGTDIPCPPSRDLLYTKGGLSLTDYHELTQRNILVQCEDQVVQNVLCPTYVSCTFMKDYQLMDTHVQLQHELMYRVPPTFSGPPRRHQEPHVQLHVMPYQNLHETVLGQTFPIDPMVHTTKTHDDAQQNVHMQTSQH